jgi:hypothetical protein
VPIVAAISDTDSGGGRQNIEAKPTAAAIRAMVAKLGFFRVPSSVRAGCQEKRKSELLFKEPETWGSRRLIPLPAFAIDRLKRHRRDRSMHYEGASYRQIAKWLTDTGLRPKGSVWYAASVRAILNSRMSADSSEVKVACPPEG